MIIIINID